ncbi:hypothetical protein R1sor_003290 [Riccia sorocarpa]|uniref:F-box/kelch-repeat protein n=1 Tax=Riccia sorocarpa TaxID=122646 RepID=A0ABD3H1Y7_9MARC
MDSEVWKHLPDHGDILRLTLSRVSWYTNLRLRSVSKAFYATLSEPSLCTWSSMLTDTSFYTNHPNLEWVDGGGDHLEQSHADAVCLISTDAFCFFGTSESVTYAAVNFELDRWCNLPLLGDLPFGDLNDFTVTGGANGLLLLEKGRRSDGVEPNIYELDRFLFNPLTKGFTKLPVVPKVKDPSASKGNGLRSRMIMAVEKEVVTVVATEFSQLHSVESAVLVGGELFLHTVDNRNGDGPPSSNRVFSSGSRETDPELIFTCEKEFSDNPVIHLFQYKGALKRLELAVVTGWRCHIKLFTFDSLSRSWQEEEIEMPKDMQKSLKQWSDCCVKGPLDHWLFSRTLFLWSPQRIIIDV